MRVCLQRVSQASVAVVSESEDPMGCPTIQIVGQITRGFVALIGVTHNDTEQDVTALVEKIAHLRVFADTAGKLNLSLLDIGGDVLAISQFTLYADCRKGRRPSFSQAATPSHAEALYDRFVAQLRSMDIRVPTGRFGAHMQVELINDGPATILLESLNGSVL